MLLVRDSMSREVIAITPETTAAQALALCRERRIRHLPVIDGERLVGIVSDRDLRSATPALGDPQRTSELERIRASEVMTRDPVTTIPDEPIESAANMMRERWIGCLPVVEDGDLVGVITSSDVMEALVFLVGAHEPGSRFEVVVPDRPGTLAGAAGIFGELGINIVSVAMGARREEMPDGSPGRAVVFRVDTVNPGEAAEVLEQAGYRVLWPPAAPV